MKKIILLPCLALLLTAIFVSLSIAQSIDYINSLHWMGANEVKIQGSYGYYCFDPGLVIIDFSDIEQPSVVSRLYIPGSNLGVAVHDNYAFIYGDHDKLRVIDITDHQNPLIIGELYIDSEIDDIWAEDDLLYVAAGQLGMLIVDISAPFNPEIISQYPAANDTRTVVVCDSLAYVAGRFIYPASRPFQIVNVSDPYYPTLAGSIAQDIGWNHDMIIDGDYAYLANTYRGFIIIDISNPGMPFIIAQLEDETYPWNLAKSGDLMFVNHSFDTLQVFDVSVPSLPDLIETYIPENHAGDFDIVGNYLYIAGTDLSVLDVSNINDIHQVSAYDLPGPTTEALMIGDYLYTAESGFGLCIHRLDDPANPDHVASFELPEYYYKYYASDHYLYALCEQHLAIIDISDPSAPGQVCYHQLEDDYFDICVNEPYIYLLSFSMGISVFEQIAQDSLEYVRDFRDLSFTFGAEIENDIGFFSQDFQLLVYDLTNPEDSTLLSSIFPASGAGWPYVHDGFVYTQMVDGQLNMDLSIVDVTDPANPVNADPLSLPDYIEHIAFDGDLCFISVYPGRIFVYDIADPYSPVYLCETPTPGYCNGIATYDDYIYVADGSSLLVLRFTPTGIERISSIPDMFVLSPNYPNPFNAQTTIHYSLPQASAVILDIYDILGRKVQTLYHGNQTAGNYSVIWDADGFSSGVYLYKLTAGDYEQTQKMMLMK